MREPKRRGTVNDTQIEQIYAGISQIALAEASQKMGINHEDSGRLAKAQLEALKSL